MIIVRHDPSLAMASALDYGMGWMYFSRFLVDIGIMLHWDPQLVYSLAIQRAVHASLNGVVRLVTRRWSDASNGRLMRWHWSHGRYLSLCLLFLSLSLCLYLFTYSLVLQLAIVLLLRSNTQSVSNITTNDILDSLISYHIILNQITLYSHYTYIHIHLNSHRTAFSPPRKLNRNSNHRRTNLASESIDWDMNARTSY